MTETLSPELDERFRAAAAAADLLDAAFDVLEDTPVGPLLVGVTDRGLCRISFDAEPEHHLESLARLYGPRVLRSAKPFERLRSELDEYFAGRRRQFDLELDLRFVPEFHRQVLDELARVDGQAARGAGGRHGDEPQPDPDRAAVPPCGRRVRQPDGLRRRSRPQGAAAPARGRDSVAKRFSQNDASSTGCDGRRGKDAGSVDSSTIGATEGAASRRPARPALKAHSVRAS